VYVCEPDDEVSRCPGEPDPFESVQELIPGPLVASEQEKLVATDCPTA
jgi:hypothetical protein